MEKVIAEIQELGVLDPAAQGRLLESLRETPPDLWPLVSQQFRAALAYRRQVEQKELAAGRSDASSDRTSLRREPPSNQPVARQEPPSNQPVARQGELPRHDASSGLDRLPQGPTVESHMERSLVPHTALLPSAGGPSTHSTAQSVPRQEPSQPPPDRSGDGGADGRVVATSYISKPGISQSGDDWRQYAAEAARVLASTLSQTPQTDREIAEHARLRMLHLITGRREDALQPIPSVVASAQDFWSQELYGLATLLDTERISESARRSAEAQRHLGEALRRLGESSPLVVKNLTFVTNVQSYGAFTPVEKYEFMPAQKVLLYAEVENFTSKETAKGYHTALRSSYQIFDSRGQRIADHEFNTSEEYCGNPRRDFFIGYQFPMPERIYPGKYVLQLTVVDLNSEKIGQSSIEFTVGSRNE